MIMISRLSAATLALLLGSVATATLAQSPAAAPPSALPSTAPSNGRVHLHRPGTDIDADALEGNLGAQTYTVSGHVVVHSDPKVDRSVATTESDEPLTLTADRVDVDERARRFLAKGSVRFMQGIREGSCDEATLDEASHDLELIGHARVAEGPQSARADRMHYNTLDKHFRGAGNVKIIAPIPSPTPGAPGSPAPAPKKRRSPLGL